MLAPVRPLVSTGLAMALALAGSAPVPAQTAKPSAPAPSSVDPKARQLLEEVVKNYRALDAYTDQGQLLLTARIGGEAKREEKKRNLAFERPNRLALDYGSVRLVSDGKTVTSAIMPLKKYLVSPAPARIDDRALMRLPLPAPGATAGVLLAGEGGLPMAVLLELLGGTDPARGLLESFPIVKLEADRPVDGKPARVLLLQQPKGGSLRMFVDAKTKLLSRIEVIYQLDEINAKLPAERKISELTVAWVPGPVSRDVPKGTFAFPPPEGFAAFDPAAPATLADLVGKPAPDFSLTVLDAKDKTRTVTKADLAGKVVLLDFWATWCGPCLKELPQVQQMVDDLARAKKSVVIVALSQDEDPREPTALRKLVEKTLSDNKLTLAQGPVSMVALDPKHAIGDAFIIEAIPSLVLLDAQGIVQAAHVGYTDRAVIAREIDALLAGKPLPQPEPPASEPAPSKDQKAR